MCCCWAISERVKLCSLYAGMTLLIRRALLVSRVTIYENLTSSSPWKSKEGAGKNLTKRQTTQVWMATEMLRRQPCKQFRHEQQLGASLRICTAASFETDQLDFCTNTGLGGDLVMLGPGRLSLKVHFKLVTFSMFRFLWLLWNRSIFPVNNSIILGSYSWYHWQVLGRRPGQWRIPHLQ